MSISEHATSAREAELLDDPLGEHGAGDCDADAGQCEFRATADPADAMDASEVSMRDEVAEQMPVEEIPMAISPADGLPVPADEHTLATAVPFDRRHLVCLADDTSYVEVFYDEYEDWATDHGAYALVPDDEDGTPLEFELGKTVIAMRERFDADGTSIERRTFSPDLVVERWGATFVVVTEPVSVVGKGGRAEPVRKLVPVRPVRPVCKHYRRQVMPNDEITDETAEGHLIHFSHCTMRRSLGGAFMSLMNDGVYACGYREPADPTTYARYIESFDRSRLAKKTEMVPLFNIRPRGAEPPAGAPIKEPDRGPAPPLLFGKQGA